MFRTPILLKDYPKINDWDWLAKLELEMRNDLAYLFVTLSRSFRHSYGVEDLFTASTSIAWVEKYPAQIVSLAIQIAWTASVESSLERGQEGFCQLFVLALICLRISS